VYEAGIGFENSAATAEGSTPNKADRHKNSSQSPNADTDIPEFFCCCACGQTDHRRSDSTLCPKNNGAADIEQLASDAEYQTQLDAFVVDSKEAEAILKEFLAEDSDDEYED
jgi:hypothetical protein